MPKRIILCSDGTGNKGGSTPDSNVFKLYNAIDNIDPGQVTYYDNGVGTATNKYLRAISGAFGFGFNSNVMDLYEFLARQYEPDSEIFLFGFSRGAATIRAFAGMLQVVGLLHRESEACKSNGTFDESKFQVMIEKARQTYIHHKSNPQLTLDFRKDCTENFKFDPTWRIKIKFIGVWDTVSALGFPQDWSKGVQWLFAGLDYWTEFVSPHSYYEYQLDEYVECACHALALDDERKTFHPKIWWEKSTSGLKAPESVPKDVHQVWFAGMHSNVGGGYERAGMASVPLHWMMCWAARHGLKFQDGAIADASDAANENDKLYDSRDGLAVYYRYAPREIEKYWGDRFEGPVKIHASVDQRVKQGTARYAPGFLPFQIEIVETPFPDQNTPPPVPINKQTAEDHTTWQGFQDQCRSWVDRRKRLYQWFVEGTLVLIGIISLLVIFPVSPDFPDPNTGIGWLFSIRLHLADLVAMVLPDFLEPLITFAFVARPWSLAAFALLIALFMYQKGRYRSGDARARENARREYLDSNEQWVTPFVLPETDKRTPYPKDRLKPALWKIWLTRVAALGVWVFLIGQSVVFLASHKPSERACGVFADAHTRILSNVGDRTTTVLDAGKYWNASGLLAEKGGRYQVTFARPAGAVWKDGSHNVDPNTGWWPKPGKSTLNWDTGVHAFTEWLDFALRVAGEPLSVPIGSIRGSCYGGRLCEQRFRIPPSGTTFTAPADGEFCGYANDLSFAYANNSGRLTLTITRVE